ncbi:unnamed protein product [Acanthoscelides obtectus]|uniref:Chitin-binding type-2 domain-containing protein n=1 Tax=Acanthoscelides obtectus TaxID=200917 RepID=A0A9P0LMJ4_ACAOB|nr:unnamed protein product [Acanthoscelides obtectus]CAK1671317.1 hypothetical protein AOBTE_LOCUS28221 [Acanthoscelides obtectus]
MNSYLISICLFLTTAHCISQSAKSQIRQEKRLQKRDYGQNPLKNFRPSLPIQVDEEYDDDDSQTGATQDRTPTFQNYPIPVKVQQQQFNNYPAHVKQTPKPYPIQHQQQRRPQEGRRPEGNKLEDKEEEEEPDRLTELLPQTKFTCNARTTGYYADEELGCEVFHYCQDNARHSWICPNGFTFHQVHLICMPPGNDNICEKSSSFHFVNDYLYKPINLEEYQHKPNVTLRYSDRYYPDARRQQDDGDNQHLHSVSIKKLTMQITKMALLIIVAIIHISSDKENVNGVTG